MIGRWFFVLFLFDLHFDWRNSFMRVWSIITLTELCSLSEEDTQRENLPCASLILWPPCLPSDCLCSSQSNHADAGRVHHPQWIFPPNTATLAELCCRPPTRQPHLPHLHNVNKNNLFSKCPSNVVVSCSVGVKTNLRPFQICNTLLQRQ